uniref:Uncharacterized protein n=1 Tax=Pithovirus LCPAC403 TaxID=2506596 RepID=A0A481ZAF4_9VIRU|nr:MAG: hypothetical protein LCPAC403_00180 [Pithovirus LCPAC403]
MISPPLYQLEVIKSAKELGLIILHVLPVSEQIRRFEDEAYVKMLHTVVKSVKRKIGKGIRKCANQSSDLVFKTNYYILILEN